MLFQGGLTSLLLYLADAGAFDPIWSDAISAEWVRNLEASMGIPGGKIEHRRNRVDRAFPSASVQADLGAVERIQGLCRTAGQKKDAHVVATAVAAKAGLIVTHNIRDFDPAILKPFGGLRRIKPDPFCVELLADRQDQALAGLRAHRASLRKTPIDAAGYVAHLADRRMGLPKLACALAPHQAAL